MAIPAITSSLSPIAATLGVAIANYTITASGVPTSFDAKGLPAGLALNTATGVISGTPTAGGQFSVIIVAENGSGNDYAILPIMVSVASGIFNDGGIPIGSQVVAIGGTNYIFDDFNPSEESKEIGSTDQLGRPNRAAYIRQKIKGSGTIQLASATTAIPALFTTFVATHRGANKTFVITKVGIPQKAGEEIKVPVDISEILNP